MIRCKVETMEGEPTGQKGGAGGQNRDNEGGGEFSYYDRRVLRGR